jgi:hypothetical protein
MKRLAVMLVCSAACVGSSATAASAFPTQPPGASPTACVNVSERGGTGAANANAIALANVAVVYAALCT